MPTDGGHVRRESVIIKPAGDDDLPVITHIPNDTIVNSTASLAAKRPRRHMTSSASDALARAR